MWFRAAVSVFIVALASLAGAQETAAPISRPVLIIDQEELFQSSQYAQSLLAALEAESQELAAENRVIEAELVAEEKTLTELRKTLPVEEFRELASVFDEKVIALRAQQDEKARAIFDKRESLQQEFYQAALPYIAQITREVGAQVVLDARTVFLSAGSVDITQEAAGRIDAALVSPSEPDENAE